MDSNETLIKKFYQAFAMKDYRTMQSLYHPEARFTDPVFQHLSSQEVKAMWEMLVSGSADLKVSFRDAVADADAGRCHWDAWYTFTATGRQVHNRISARFLFRDGLIFRHDDHFNFWRWSRQALGIPGLLLGWSPYLMNQVRMKARRRLEKFMAAGIS